MSVLLHHAAAHAVGRERKIIKANVLTSNLPPANHRANALSHTLFTTPLEASTIFMSFLQVS